MLHKFIVTAGYSAFRNQFLPCLKTRASLTRLREFVGCLIKENYIETLRLLFLNNKENQGEKQFRIWNQMQKIVELKPYVDQLNEINFTRFGQLKSFHSNWGITINNKKKIENLAQQSGFNTKRIVEVIQNLGQNFPGHSVRGLQDIITINTRIEDKVLLETIYFKEIIQNEPIQFNKYRDSWSSLYNLRPSQVANYLDISNIDFMLGFNNKPNLNKLFNRIFDKNNILDLTTKNSAEKVRDLIINIATQFSNYFNGSTSTRYHDLFDHDNFNMFEIISSSILSYDKIGTKYINAFIKKLSRLDLNLKSDKFNLLKLLKEMRFTKKTRLIEDQFVHILLDANIVIESLINFFLSLKLKNKGQ